MNEEDANSERDRTAKSIVESTTRDEKIIEEGKDVESMIPGCES